MQWLGPMDTLVACKGELVYCTKPNGSIFELTNMRTLPNTPLLSTKQFKKWLQKDENLFTISVHKPINEPMNEMVGKRLEKYSNVFLTELPNLSLIKEVDCVIDLMSYVKLISRTPCQFSFTKYEELEQQLSDLLNKG